MFHSSRTFAPTLGLAALAALFSLAAPHAARAQSYTITDLGTLGGSSSFGSGVNNSGQVTGYADVSGIIAQHAFLYSGGHMKDLGTLGGFESMAFGINSSGQVAGYSYTSSGDAEAFLYSGGPLIGLGTLGGTQSNANAINDSGQITGDFTIASGNTHAFLYSSGHMTDLGTLPGGTESEGIGINSSGQVVGDATLPGGNYGGNYHAVLYSGGHITDLGTLGGTFSSATAINTSGQITGDAYTFNDNALNAFVYSNGHMTNIDTLHSYYSSGTSINSSGQVVGFASFYSGSTPTNTAFVYSPGTGMADLSTLISHASGWQLTSATGISDTGFITGYGTHNGQTHAFLLTPVSNSAVFITGLSPDVVDMGSATFTLTVSGIKFVPTTIVRWNGQALATTYVSSTQLTASVPASLLVNSGTADITVQTPSVATSGAATFHIRPLIASLSPTSAASGSAAFTLTVNGSGYTSNSIVVLSGTNLATTFVSSTKLTALVPASLLAANHGRGSVMVTIPHVATSRGVGFDFTQPF